MNLVRWIPFVSGILALSAQAQTNASLPACFLTGAGGTVANVGLNVGQLCIDDGKIKKLFKECKGSEATSSFDFSRCIKNASKTEIASQFSVQAGSISVCPSSGSGGCATVDAGAASAATSVNSASAAVPPASSAGGMGGGSGLGGRGDFGGGPSMPGASGMGMGNGGMGTGGRVGLSGGGAARTDAQTDVDILARHCGDQGDLNGYDVTRQGDLETINDTLKNYAPNCSGSDCISLTALKAAMTTSLNSCHNACVHMALDQNGSCFWKNITGSGKFQNENEFCQVLTANESDSRVNDFLAAYPGNQSDCKTLSARNTDTGGVCRAMLGDKSCAQVMRSDDFSCDAFKPAADAYYAALATYEQMLADQRVLNGPSDSRKCKISNASSATRAFDLRDTVSIKCLIDMQSSCSLALDSAQARYETVAASQRSFCPTCNQNQNLQASSCQYGGSCAGSVSKAADLLNGIANIGGKLIVPIAQGFMNMSMYNKSLAACTSSNAELIAAQQAQSTATLSLYSNVGLTGPINAISAGTCGTGGFGMSGYGGINGTSGIGGYNPYGTSLGSSSGYNPYASIGLGSSTTSGMGYNPYSQMGIGMSGLGMSGLGLTSGYSGYGMNQYNPYSMYGSNSGLYSNNMYQSSANMSSVMRQMAMQNQLMGGMSSSSYNPYAQYSGYGMGNYGMSNYGMNNYGISAGISLGSNYNPYAYSGASMYGSSCGYYTTGIPCSGY